MIQSALRERDFHITPGRQITANVLGANLKLADLAVSIAQIALFLDQRNAQQLPALALAGVMLVLKSRAARNGRPLPFSKNLSY